MRIFSFFSSLLIGALFASAQAPFDEVVNTIISSNADLQAQLKNIAAQRYDAADANSLADPQVDFARVWGGNHVGNKLQLDISQSFDWPGVYSARSHAAAMEAEVAASEYDVACFELSNQVRAMLTELVYVRRQKGVINEVMANFNSLSDAVDRALRGGELTVLDQRKMQIERYEIENQLASILTRENQLISDIDALSTVSVDLSGIVAYPIQPLLSLQEYVDLLPSDPNVRALALSADSEALNAKVASQSRMPSFSVGYQHQAEMGDRFNGFTVGMSLPVFQGRHARKAAIERQSAADLSRETVIDRRKAEISGTYQALELYRSRIDAYNRTFGDNMYLNLLLKAYNGGELSVIEYLSEIHYYHQTKLAYIEAEYNYNLALTSLNCYNH